MTQIHGTTIAIGGRGLLILGPSGSGKSTLALQLLAVGAELVADDRTDLVRDGVAVIAGCPPALVGRIEARGIGLLNVVTHPPVVLTLVVDLGRSEDARLPPFRMHDVLGVGFPLVLGPYRPHLYAALRHYLLFGRRD